MEKDPRKTSIMVPNQAQNVTKFQLGSKPELKNPVFEGVRITKQYVPAMPLNIRSDHRSHAQNDPRISQRTLKQRQKPIMSREAHQKLVLKIKEMEQKRAKHLHPNHQNLSPIHEQSGQYYEFSQESGFVSQESGFVMEPSMDEFGLESEDSENWSSDKNFDQSKKKPFELEENLDKTVLMSKKKAFRQPIQAQKVQRKSNQHQRMLAQILVTYPFQIIYRNYQEGKIKQNDYKRLIQLQKERSQSAKFDKYAQNLEKVNSKANILMKNYQQLYLKLSNDVSATELKQKQLVKILNSMSKKQEKSENQFNPEKMKLELKLLEKSCEIKAKQQFLDNIQKCLDEFENKYDENLFYLDEEKRSKQNFSSILIFTEIKQFLDMGRQLYNSILGSLIKNRETGLSEISKTAKKYYIESLEEKYASEFQEIQQMVFMRLAEHLRSLDSDFVSIQDNKEMFQILFKRFLSEVSVQIYHTINHLHQDITRIRIIRENGELSSGKIYRQAMQLIESDSPTELSVQEFSQKFLIQNFKFYVKKLFKWIVTSYQPLESMYYLLQTYRATNNLNNQEKKLNGLLQQIEFCQRDTFILDTAMRRVQNSEKMLRNIKMHLIQKQISIEKLSERVSGILKQEDGQYIHTSLIPKKRVAIFNLTAQKEESNIKSNESNKSSWQDIFNQIQRKSFETHELHKQNHSIDRESIQSYAKLSCNPNLEESQQKFSQDIQHILKYSNSEEKNEEEKKKHLDKVCELIIRNQVVSEDYESRQIYQTEEHCIYEKQWGSVQLTGWKPLIDDSFIHFNHHDKINESVQRRGIPSETQSRQNDWWLTNYQSSSGQEIESARELFIREFHKNPYLLKQLPLDNHELSFLLFPEYRKQFFDKKIKDQQLTERMMQIIRFNIHPINKDSNSIKFMMKVDSDFQQKIVEYQQKIVINQKHTDPNQPKPSCDLDDMTTNADTEKYELLDQTVKEMEDSRLWDSYFQRHSEYLRRDSNSDYFWNAY